MLTIEIISKNKLEIVHHLANQIFPHTYANILSACQIDYMMDVMYSIQSLEKQIEVEKQIFHLVNLENTPCGYFSLELISPTTCILQKLYLLPSLHGKGYGKQILNEAISYIRTHIPSIKKLQLYVNRENRAKDFYLSYGFSIKESRDFHIGNGYYMNDYIMELSL